MRDPKTLWRLRPDVNGVPVAPPVSKINAKVPPFSIRRVPAIFGAYRHHMYKPGRDSVTGRTVLEREVVHIDDLAADPEHSRCRAPKIGNAADC
jgi:hypothetical protein